MGTIRPPTALIVGDDTTSDRFLRVILATHGFDVLTSADCDEAKKLLAILPCNLVLLDITVPFVDGFDHIEHLRTASDAPIIVMSTRPGEDDRQVALTMGASVYLVKPFGVAELTLAIRDMKADPGPPTN